MLTRKHYQLIAKVIKESANKEQIIENLCKELKSDNPNFDSYRFTEACK